jgi:hypothetical protein
VKPLYKHDCPDCVFVGVIRATDRDRAVSEFFDGYYCRSHHGRRGQDGLVLRVKSEPAYAGMASRTCWTLAAAGTGGAYGMAHPDAYRTLLEMCCRAGLVDKALVDELRARA